MTPRITDTRSRRLPDSTIRGVGDSPYQPYAESATPRLNNTGSQLLSVSTIRGVDDSPYHRHSEFSFKKFNSRLSVSVMRGVVDSAYQWCGESSTPHIVESECRRLCVSLIRRVADSPYHWVGESFFEYEYLRECEAKIGTARNVVCGTYAEPINAKTSENPVRFHVPLKGPRSLIRKKPVQRLESKQGIARPVYENRQTLTTQSVQYHSPLP